MRKSFSALIAFVAASLGSTASGFAFDNGSISLHFLGRHKTGIFDGSGAEIPAYDAATQRVFVSNSEDNTVDVLDVSDPANPTLTFAIDLNALGDGPNSVAVSDGVVAVAIQAELRTDPGVVGFFDTSGNLLSIVTVGALPDMLTFTPDGTRLLVGNEGEPSDDYSIDPEGTISIIDVTNGAASLTQADVTTVNFTAFNEAAIDPAIRIFGPGATVAQDLEPEYIAVSADSTTAWVALQENNALAITDIATAQVTSLLPLGFKDHSLDANAIDASNDDGIINITSWPVFGMYQPDAIAAFSADGETWLVTANEGDARDYDAFGEEERIRDLILDPVTFPNAAELQTDENLGRLNITTTLGDTDDDGDYDALYAYGARSFSIRNAAGEVIWDSGDALEQITAGAYPAEFNSNNDENDSFDARSDDKGPEPEGLTVGVIDERTYVFVGLERIGGIVVYDITDPQAPAFVQYINSRDFNGDAEADTAGDLGPEGLAFVPAGDSPTGQPLLIVTYEVSGTTAVYSIAPCAAIVGDLDGSCTVGSNDLLALLGSWGVCEIGVPCAADLDSNGDVGVSDLLMLLAAWGK